MSDAPATRRTGDAERLRELVDVGRSLTSELDLDTLLLRICETGRSLCGARYAALGVLDAERRRLSDFVTSGGGPGIREAIGEVPHGRGILGVLIDDPTPIRLRDVSQDPRSFGFPPGHPPMRNFLGVPIVIRGEAWGNLYLTDKEGADDFDDGDLEAIVVLAEWAAIAIDNARLFKISEDRRVELEQAVRRLEAARDVARALGGETDLGRILELITERARTLVDAGAFLIWLDDGGTLRLAARAGAVAGPAGAELPVGGSTTGEALRTRRAIRVDDVVRDLAEDPAGFGLASARTALMVPLVFRGRALGVLAAFDRLGDDATFTDDDERDLRTFAASAATAVATARSVETARLRDSIAAAEGERGRWARDLHDETLQGLGAIKLALSAALRAPDGAARAPVEGAVAQLESEIAALRRIIADLRPPALDELGLGPAIRTLVERVQAANDLEIDLDIRAGDRRLDPELETIAYRIAQEALTNVVKHAGARRVRLALHVTATLLELEVRDDGRGLGIGALETTGGYGVEGMRERARLAGGDVAITGAPGEGTWVVLTIPLAAERRDR